MLGTRGSRLTVLFTIASMVATINGLIGGVGVALLLLTVLGSNGAGAAVAAGILAGLAEVCVAYVYQRRRFGGSAGGEHAR